MELVPVATRRNIQDLERGPAVVKHITERWERELKLVVGQGKTKLKPEAVRRALVRSAIAYALPLDTLTSAYIRQ